MSVNATEQSWGNAELSDRASRGLLADIAGSLSYLSSEYREERKKQKLREDLVRVYIENKKPEPTLLQSVVNLVTSP